MKLFIIIWLMSFTCFAQAQGYKCRTPSGGLVISDQACPTGSSSERISASPSSSPRQTSISHGERELEGMIYEAIGQNDWYRADSLAVTARQKKIVFDARQLEKARKEKQEAELGRNRVVCSGFTEGGYTRSVCR